MEHDAPAEAIPMPPMPFMGTHELRLDEKNRMVLPARFRSRFADGLVLTPGQEHCLYVLPQAVFLVMYDAIKQAPLTSKPARVYTRAFLANSSADTPDRQGRVTVSPVLRDYARLERECVVIGAGSRLEVWNAEAWATYAAEQESAFADLSAEVIPGLSHP